LVLIKSRNTIAIKSFIIKVIQQPCFLNVENDIHYATLTVKQTLAFALKAKTPKKLPEQMSQRQYRNTFLNILLTIFGIKHTVNTRVGNEVISLGYVDLCSLYTAFLAERKRECRLRRQWSHVALLGAGITRREVSTRPQLWNIVVVFDC